MSSLTVSTAVKPTPNRPMEVGSAFPEARRAVSAWTPESSKGAPVFAMYSVRPSSRTEIRPAAPALAAASAAFCASSVSRRSR
ncbi:hypothetical protein AB0H49_02130 [Nocardia sp. NPDC050713]|uniref:hypothetical protein n=1 Tax=Nocardia sp. NPDC050713 TaxID=3154511 RepID=UPI0033FF5E46